MRPAAFAIALALAQQAAGGATSPPASPEAPKTVLLDRIAAVVGDDVVPESDIERYVRVGFLSRREGESEADYRNRCLDQRVVDLIRERELRRTAGFEPDPREVEEEYRAVSARIAKERGTPFEAILEGAGVPVAEAKGWVRQDMEMKVFVRERLLPAVKVSDAEVEAYYDGPFPVEAAASGLRQLPPLAEVRDDLKVVLRSRKLNAEIERWTAEVREKTRVLVYRRPAAP